MTADEYQDLIDARDHAAAMRAIADGPTPLIADADIDAYVEAGVLAQLPRR